MVTIELWVFIMLIIMSALFLFPFVFLMLIIIIDWVLEAIENKKVDNPSAIKSKGYQPEGDTKHERSRDY